LLSAAEETGTVVIAWLIFFLLLNLEKPERMPEIDTQPALRGAPGKGREAGYSGLC
jgi:hypothetical protein